MSERPDGAPQTGQETDPETMRQRLLTRRDELRALLAAAAEGSAAVELDQTRVGRLSRMDALQGQQMALETRRRREAEMGRIEAALQRIEDGDFGYCLSCDQPIAARRLALDPSVSLCIACAGRG